MKKMKFSRRFYYYFGYFAEYVVIFFMMIRFFSILKHRYKTPFGEIDIIAARGRWILFIEVKGRFFGFSVDNLVTYKQRSRIKKAAEYFIMQRPKLQNYKMRFDLCAISLFRLPIYIKNAW